MIDPATGVPLRIPDEERAARIAAERRWEAAERARDAAEERARREEQTRLAAEARITALEAQLRSLQERGEQDGAGTVGMS